MEFGLKGSARNNSGADRRTSARGLVFRLTFVAFAPDAARHKCLGSKEDHDEPLKYEACCLAVKKVYLRNVPECRKTSAKRRQNNAGEALRDVTQTALDYISEPTGDASGLSLYISCDQRVEMPNGTLMKILSPEMTANSLCAVMNQGRLSAPSLSRRTLNRDLATPSQGEAFVLTYIKI
ncbi:hypothetical protein E1301_Tti022253 [Triplophysa tibetana]|uniref:Uncharacterized protein n=1 Tax=Triplophysa tibetana TaxID=1572043 RepID=A0A5A9P4Y0_9TELE|nr:hypothetical protein E1301_Tti022253 [Triplophysa tibetana]